MLRITTILLCSLAFMLPGTLEADAGCGSSSGRQGISPRFRTRPTSFSARTRVRTTASYQATTIAPMQAPACTVVCPCMAGGTCTCPQTTPMSIQQAPSVVVPQSTVIYQRPARTFVTGNCPGGVCPIKPLNFRSSSL